MTSFDAVLQRADNNQYVTLEDFYDVREDDKMLEMLNHSQIDETGLTDEIIVDEDYVIEQLYEDDPFHESAKSNFENLAKWLGEEQYEKGRDKAEGKMREVRRKYNDWRDQQDTIEEKADNKEKLVKASEAGMGTGAAVTLGGINLQSIGITLIGGTTTALSAYKNPEWQGMRDREVTEAVKGWNQEYGDYVVRVD